MKELERFPQVAVLGSRIHALHGRSREAERWLEAAERSRGDAGSVRPLVALLHAARCRDGVEQMRLDAETAVSELAPDSPWRPAALLLQGSAYSLLGDDERADAILGEAVDEATRRGSNDTRVVALSERSLIATARDDHVAAGRLAREAHEIVAAEQLEGYPSNAIELAASARVLLRNGRWDDARKHLTAARPRHAAADRGSPVALGPNTAGARPCVRHAARRRGRGRAARRGQGDPGRASRARRARRAGRGASGRDRRDAGARPRCGYGTDGGRAPADASPRDASLVSRDRGEAARLPQHDQDAGDLRVPKARRVEPQRRDRGGRSDRVARQTTRAAGPPERHSLSQAGML